MAKKTSIWQLTTVSVFKLINFDITFYIFNLNHSHMILIQLQQVIF